MSDVYLLDTNIISPALDKQNHNHSRVRNFLDSLHGSIITVSVITLAEIEYGLRTAPGMDTGRQTAIRSALAAFPLVRDITRHTIEYYAELRAQLFNQYSPRDRRHRRTKYVEDLTEHTTEKELGIKENDLWIAAQSLEWNCVLVTNDAMPRIMSLKIEPSIRAISVK